MRAREPDRAGVIDRDGVDIYYEVHGDSDPTLLLIPPSPIIEGAGHLTLAREPVKVNRAIKEFIDRMERVR